MLVEQYNAMHRDYYYKYLEKDIDSTQLEKYFQTKTMQRLKGKGMFCGMDFVQMPKLKPREYYSRFDHCVNLSYDAGVWGYKGLPEQLSALFHDVGTYSFAHVNSFKKGEGLTQENDEMSVKAVLMQDKEILEYLYQDRISLDDVVDCSKFSLIDKPIPALCLDRADGILSTCLFWAKTHNFEEVKNLFEMQGYVPNLNGTTWDILSDRLNDAHEHGEMCIGDTYDAEMEDYFRAINSYSSLLLSKESRYFMEVFGMVLNYYQELGLFTDRDLFYLSEQDIVNRILSSKYSDVWTDFIHMSKVWYAKSDKGLVVLSQPKIRQANPLVWGQMQLCECHSISGDFYQELNPLWDDIEKTYQPLVGNLSHSTTRKLSKYNKKTS